MRCCMATVILMRMDMLQGRLGKRRLQGSVMMTWRSNSAGGLERYSVWICGCMFRGCGNNNRSMGRYM